MKKETINLAYAQSLLADIRAANDRILLQRDTMVDWLEECVERAAAPGYELKPEEIEQLNALKQFLQVRKVAGSTRA